MKTWRSPDWASLSVIVVGLFVACAGRPGPEADHGDPDSQSQPALPETSVGQLDAELERLWSDAGVEPSALTDDAEFLRRVSLDLIGRVPTHDEVARVLDEGPAREVLVDELLASEAFAAHWASLWAARLLPGDRRAQRYASDALESYFDVALAQNRGWGEVVTELLVSEGSLADSPQLAYVGARRLRGNNEQDALAELSSTTARVFLGSRIECAQCHDHPYVSDFSRADFWAQTAYFGRTTVSLQREDKQVEVEVGERVRGELRVALGDDDDPRKRAIAPRFMGAERSTIDAQDPRRPRLAAAIIEDPRFAQATVGWVWTQLMGQGIVEPWDELLALDERPPLLELLAAQFRASDHDLRELVRAIVLSQAYQRSSAGSGAGTRDIAAAEAVFARAPVRSLSAEQLFASLLTVTELEQVEDRAFRRAVRGRKETALREYEFVFADDEMASADGFSGSVPQALLLLNGGLTNHGVIVRPGSSLDRILATSDETDARLEDLWLTVYGRPPRADELELGRAAVTGSRERDWEDLMFAMLYSSEFSTNH